jgi:hypothetical protein
MKHIILAAALLAPFTALAEEPATIILPTPVVAAIMHRLAQDPAVQLLQTLQGCIAVQAPNAQGSTTSRGECPAVTAAMAAKPHTP